MNTHCCFCVNKEDFYPNSRIHVPMAPICTMGCIYCQYSENKNISDELRPGVASYIVQDNFDKYLESKLKTFEHNNVIGVSGPGDPLENFDKLEELYNVIEHSFPTQCLCICTNGRLFFEHKESLTQWKKLKYYTVTINSLREDTIEKLYRGVRNTSEAEKLLLAQLSSVEEMAKNGKTVKVNTILLPGINDDEIEAICVEATKRGAYCINLLAYQKKRHDDIIPYTQEEINEKESILRNELVDLGYKLTVACKRCRSDYCGY